MNKRLQVVMDTAEYGEIQQAAEARRLTVSQWVRQALRAARTEAGTAASPSPDLVRAVMERHALSSPAEAIDFALRRAAQAPLTRADLLDLRGSGWPTTPEDPR